jgi:DNA-binding LytR/AlgR family response regulator
VGPEPDAGLPPRLGQGAIALRMEDHDVRVSTDRGGALVLMRMADAVAEVSAIAGLRTHRSWWLARSAVTGVRREGSAARLEARAIGRSTPVRGRFQISIR